MKYSKSRILIFFTVVMLIVCLFPLSALAASAGISLSRSSVNIGSTFTATLSFSGGSTYVAGVQAYVTYDSSLIQFTGASGDGQANISGGKGNVVLETTSTSKTSLSITLSFKALAEGTASIKIVSSDMVDWDGVIIGNPTASKSIAVKTPTATPSASTSTKPDDPVETPPGTTEIEEALEVEIGGTTLYLWRDLSNVTLPDGFTAAEYTYKEESVQAATSEAKALTLLYLTDAEGTNGQFYLYGAETDVFSEYVTMIFSTDEYVILLPDDSVSIPEGYEQDTRVVNGKVVTAWEPQKGSAFFLIYAMNSDGVAGFYSYDSYEMTLQRFNETTRTTRQEETSRTGASAEIVPDNTEDRGVLERLIDDEQILAITAVLAGMIVILMTVILNMLISRKKKAVLAMLEPYMPEEEEEPPEEERHIQKELPGARPGPEGETREEQGADATHPDPDDAGDSPNE